MGMMPNICRGRISCPIPAPYAAEGKGLGHEGVVRVSSGFWLSISLSFFSPPLHMALRCLADTAASTYVFHCVYLRSISHVAVFSCGVTGRYARCRCSFHGVCGCRDQVISGASSALFAGFSRV